MRRLRDAVLVFLVGAAFSYAQYSDQRAQAAAEQHDSSAAWAGFVSAGE